MSEESVLSEKRIDPDIEAILDQVGIKATRAYRLGFVDGQKQILDDVRADAMANIKDKMAAPAELFYHSLLKIVPKEDILQHRIGKDYATGVPTTLTVLSQRHGDKLVDILRMAAELELYLYHEHDRDCSFWVIIDLCLDQLAINYDFPYCRRDI